MDNNKNAPAVVTAALNYLKRDFLSIPIPAGEKKPNRTDWQKLRLTESDIPAQFRDGCNIGILLGEPSNGLVDVDLDAPEAVAAADLLPQTELILGHPSNPNSHYFYRVSPSPKYLIFSDPCCGKGNAGSTLVELRQDGHQTLVPPSQVDGEVRAWVRDGAPAWAEGPTLSTVAAHVAATAVLVRYWPVSGRHDARMALGGALLRAGWPEEKTIAFVRRVVRIAQAGDNEACGKVASDTRAASEKLQRNEPVTGLPRLSEMLRAPIICEVTKWLQLGDVRNGAPPLLTHTITGSRNTDVANGKRLASRNENKIRYSKPVGWLFYDDARWGRDEKGDGVIMLRAKETALSIYEEAREEKDVNVRKVLGGWAIQSESAGRLHNMIELAKSEPRISVTTDGLDADPWLFNCLNGTLDLRTGTLRDHRPEDLITKQSPIIFDPHATCPVFISFLERIFLEKPRLIDYIQRIVGYCLTGLTHEQVLFFLFGLGANGKTTLIEILRRLLGEYGRAINPKTLLDINDSEAKFDLADIWGARLVVASEPEGGRRLAEALVKQVTGGDHIKARNMYKDYFEYVPQFKIFIVSNHRFAVDGGSEAIARRLRMLPFEERIPEGERDRFLLDKLRDELPGILNWAIEGCLAWQRDGLGIPDEVKVATREFMAENDEVQLWIEARCVVRESVSEGIGTLYKDFEHFAKENGNEHPMKARALGRKLNDKGFQRDTRGRGNYIRLGIALRTEDE